MMGEPVRPALTPEEWAACEHQRSEGQPATFRATGGAGVTFLDVEIDGSLELQVWGEDRHAVAALALFHEPYGFTWADVDAMEAVYGHIISDMRPGFPAEQVERCYYLMARIVALLPPREGTA